MTLHFPRITDWSAAYDNRAAVPAVDAWMQTLTRTSQAWRAAYPGRVDEDLRYGDHPRERYDLWHPVGAARGTLVFVHGGYWRAGDRRSYWAVSRTLLQAGWRVAFPTYPLCPEVSIERIAGGLRAAVHALAAQVPDGPLVLAGHSAGGHLVTWLGSSGGALDPAVLDRVTRIVSLSGVHDLRPVRRSQALNVDLRLSPTEAARLSPVLHTPAGEFELACLCGGAELPEFRRQNALLANLWSGLGVAGATALEVEGANHFTLLDGLLHDAGGGPVARWLIG